jgi:hypothetical protein
MASENRIYTQNPFQEVTSAKLNDIQDNFCMSWELDQSTLAPTTPLEGATLYYGQGTFTMAAAGGWGVNILDSSRDWRNRVLDIRVVHKGAANLLPKGLGPYDPNVSLNEKATLMYTQTGATVAALPAGFYWVTTDGANNRRIFAASNAAAGVAIGDLCIWVDPGGAADSWVMVHVIQLPDAS